MSDMEVWKPVPGYEGFYSVSDLERVRSDKRTIVDKNGHSRRIPGAIITPEKKSSGYLIVRLWKNHDQTKRYVHRIVLETFVGEAPAGMQACHWNDDKEDNRPENLRWGTPNENMFDRVRNGIHHNAVKTHCKWGHEFTPENTKPQSGKRGRDCKACGNARTRAKRRGMTLQEYLESESKK